MTDKIDIHLDVLIVSRRKEILEEVESVLRDHQGLRIRRKLVVNGHVDPLHDVDTPPDALVLHLGDTWQAELESLAARPADRRPSLIAIGTPNGTQGMRLAMQAGARDLLPLPLVPQDLIAALARIERDQRAAGDKSPASLTAFMNAKGGSGATLLACNVAHVLAAVSRKKVALVDLDLQFGAIPLYFDLYPKRGVLQALQHVDELDEVALDGYFMKHSSGLKVLGSAAEDTVAMQSADARAVERLLDVATPAHDHLVVDLPRRFDPLANVVIERARHVVVVVQQSLATLRDATRLLNCMRRELAVSKERLVIVANRYDKNAPISVEDIRSTLGCDELSLIPNDFRTVSECINTGTPLHLSARGAPITKAVMELETRLGGNSATARPGLLSRTFSSLINARST